MALCFSAGISPFSGAVQSFVAERMEPRSETSHGSSIASVASVAAASIESVAGAYTRTRRSMCDMRLSSVHPVPRSSQPVRTSSVRGRSKSLGFDGDSSDSEMDEIAMRVPGKQFSIRNADSPIDDISSSKHSWYFKKLDSQRGAVERSEAALKDIHEEKDPTRHRLMTMEVIAKGLSYARLIGDDTEDKIKKVMIPQWIGGKSVLIEFQVVAHDLGSGNLVYIFLPEEKYKGRASPIFSFRGTSLKDPCTVRSSLGFRAVSDALFGFYSDVGGREVQNNKEGLRDILAELNKEGYTKKALFTGHSLGASMAQKFMCEEGIYDKVDKMIVFNSPSINRSATKNWNELVKSGKVNDDIAQVYNAKGDHITSHTFSFLNHYFVGRKYEVDPTDRTDFNAHSSCMTSRESAIKTIKRSDAGRTIFKTMLVGLVHLIKLPIVLAVMLLVSLPVEIVAGVYSAFSQDKADRAEAHQTVDIYHAALLHKMAEANKMKKGDHSQISPCIDVVKQLKAHHRIWWARDKDMQDKMLEYSRMVLGRDMVAFLW